MFRPLILLIFLVVPGFVSAQIQPESSLQDSLKPHPINEVVITARRFNSVAINTPEAVRAVDNRTIGEYQLRTSPEALALTPGVFVQKTNHGGGSPFIRGLTGNQTLLLFDGIRISNSTMRYGPNQYFNTIDPFSAGRMEVLRGSGSVQYGSDAIGGTVQAFSHETGFTEEADWGGAVLGRISTHGMEQTLHSNISFSNRLVAARAGVSLRKFGDIVGGDTTGRQAPSGYDEADHDFKARVLLSPKTSLTMLYQNVRQTNIPVYHKVVLENYAVNETDPQTRRLAYARLNTDIDAGFLKSGIITASFQQTREGRSSRKNNSDILRHEYDKVRTFGLSAEALVSDDDLWSGNIGVEFYSDLVNSTRSDIDLATSSTAEKRGLYPDGSTMNSLALFTVHSFDLPRWNVTAGARFNSYVINVDDQELGMTKLTPSALVGNLAFMRKLSSGSGLFVSLNTGFRAPNIDDLGTLGIVDFRYETPNFDLKPESSLQCQVGYKYGKDGLRGEVYLYRNELYNLITRIRVEGQEIEGYPLYTKENSERAYIQGFETAWDYSPESWLNLSGSLTYTYGQNITKNEPVRRIPPLFGRLAAEYRPDNWHAGAEWLAAASQERLAQGDIDDNRIPDGGTPGWNIFNLNGGYAWNFMAADLSFRNILNKDYRYHGSGINGYGRSVFLTVQVIF
jgi:outer membrane receptor protein involved in Fe transport